jgi:hypothetical protein
VLEPVRVLLLLVQLLLVLAWFYFLKQGIV